MQKPIVLATSVAILFTGCHTKSPTWQTVMSTSRVTGDAEDRDRAYAAELHRQLGPIPHKIVTYEVDRISRVNGPQAVQRTSVIYYDKQNEKQPWWVMDEALDRPVWVPNKSLQHQVSFLARRPARVLEVHDYTVARDKVIQRLEKRRDKRPIGTSTLQRVEAEDAPVVVKTRGTAQVEEPKEPKPRWRLFGRRSEKKETPATRLEPATTKRAATTSLVPVETKAKATARSATPAEQKKSADKAKPAEKAARKPSAEEEKSAPNGIKSGEKRSAPAEEKKPSASGERDKTAPAAESKKAAPKETEPKRKEQNAADTDRKKRPSLFHREREEDDEPAPRAFPIGTGAGAADRPRPNFFQRIFSTLNPARWFRKTA